MPRFEHIRLRTTPSGLKSGSSPIIYDAFTDSDATLLSAHTIAPINIPGTSWAQVNNTQKIYSNTAANTGSWDYCVCDAGSANVTITATLYTGQATTYSMSQLLFRYQDQNNCWKLELNPANTYYRIIDRVATAETERAIGSVTTLAINTSYEVVLVLSGNSISATINGVDPISWTSATFNTKTKHGVFPYYGGTLTNRPYVDDFKVYLGTI